MHCRMMKGYHILGSVKRHLLLLHIDFADIIGCKKRSFAKHKFHAFFYFLENRV